MPTFCALPPALDRGVSGFASALLSTLALAAALTFAPSCSPSAREPEPSQRVADSAWRRIEQERRDLLEQRKRFAAGVVQAPETAATAELRRAVERRSEAFSRRLVAFLNDDPPREKEPLSPRQAQAIRWKSEEDIYLARGYVERAGDFRRAEDILEAALALDPGHLELRAELERIRAARFMTPERFAKVKNGMSPDDVRNLLGAPNPHNVREYLEHGPGRGVIGWFYPKDDRGAAAGVWFTKEHGTPSVYRTDFSAIQPDGEPLPAAPVERRT
ncbi:MAG TPA: hypothetical protein VN851_06740 [Thermoanaerobaculia bacterium]|nr:hypothetical protein [Thermoanaerobaculia bacterium]